MTLKSKRSKAPHIDVTTTPSPKNSLRFALRLRLQVFLLQWYNGMILKFLEKVPLKIRNSKFQKRKTVFFCEYR